MQTIYSKYMHGMSASATRCMAVVFFITLSASSCNNPMPDRFNCVEAGQNPLTGQVFTKIGGTNTSLDMIGIKNNSLLTGLVANTVNNVTFQIVDATSGNACNSLPLLSTITTNINFPSGNARLPFSFTVPNIATKRAQCRIIHADVGTSCSSDTFVIRPASFTSVTSNLNADLAGTNANAGTLAAGNVVKVGANFTLTASTGLATYTGLPTIDLSKIDAHVGAIQAGALTGVFNPAVNGTATGNAFTYSEVGYFRLLSGGVIDNTFSATDQANGGCIAGSTSNAVVGGRVGCNIGSAASTAYFGRFIPNGFRATPIAVTNGCGSFSYFGGEFTTRFDLQAINASSPTPTVTRNYHGTFAKFANNAIATDYTRYGVQNVGLTNPASTMGFTPGSQAPVVNTAWSQGRATITLTHRTARPLADTGPQSPVINILPTDGEAGNASPTPITTDTAGAATSVAFRYGRASVANAYGAETMPLTFDVNAQYFDNTGRWVNNTADNCTSLLPTAFTTEPIGGAGNNLTDAYKTNGWLTNVGNFAGGKGKFKLRAPGHGNNGWLVINTPAVPELGPTKQMRASFGQYKSALIYSREN
jgi:MSHA biogenesis protein MshQ